jgi:hypothetical protein
VNRVQAVVEELIQGGYVVHGNLTIVDPAIMPRSDGLIVNLNPFVGSGRSGIVVSVESYGGANASGAPEGGEGGPGPSDASEAILTPAAYAGLKESQVRQSVRGYGEGLLEGVRRQLQAVKLDPPAEVPANCTRQAVQSFQKAAVPDLSFEQVRAMGMGYSGNTCVSCGSAKMKRSGTCETCQDCGNTSGCG